MNFFPFAAIVGQEKLKTALIVCAVNHTIGGVLIRGDKGTAKSTAARALAQVMAPLMLMPGCKFNCQPDQPISLCDICRQPVLEPIESPVPFVDLPLGATEDRVIGSLDFERALKDGLKAFQPGLLASAHRGILYIDEVNLLPDHLVDVLLDVAAMGENQIQREGLSFSHPAHIALIGTMNPEEGDLRPQLLDRFGIMVEVAAPKDSQARAEVVRRRLSFEKDPTSFCLQWSKQLAELQANIVQAQAILPAVKLSDDLLNLISSICCEMDVPSLRADIVISKVACTLAALDGRITVNLSDIREAAELALPHRRRRKPTDKTGLSEEQLQSLLQKAQIQSKPSDELTASDDDPVSNSSSNKERQQNVAEEIFEAVKQENDLKFKLQSITPNQSSGKRTVVSGVERGQYVRAVLNERPQQLAVDATIRHSILRNGGELKVSRADFHEKVRVGKNGSLIIFVIDSSGSMAALKCMELVKGTAIALLDDIYQQRDRVAVIAFRGEKAELVVSPTRSIDIVQERLNKLPTGGRTPLAAALYMVTELLAKHITQQQGEPLVILLCDGKANVSLRSEQDPWIESLTAASLLAENSVPAIVADTETGYTRFKKAKELADAMGAEYLVLEDLTSQSLTLKIRSRLRSSRQTSVRSRSR